MGTYLPITPLPSKWFAGTRTLTPRGPSHISTDRFVRREDFTSENENLLSTKQSFMRQQYLLVTLGLRLLRHTKVITEDIHCRPLGVHLDLVSMISGISGPGKALTRQGYSSQRGQSVHREYLRYGWEKSFCTVALFRALSRAIILRSIV